MWVRLLDQGSRGLCELEISGLGCNAPRKLIDYSDEVSWCRVLQDAVDVLRMAEEAMLYGGSAPTVDELEVFCRPDEPEVKVRTSTAVACAVTSMPGDGHGENKLVDYPSTTTPLQSARAPTVHARDPKPMPVTFCDVI